MSGFAPRESSGIRVHGKDLGSWYQAEWLGDAWIVDGGGFLLRIVLAFENRD